MEIGYASRMTCPYVTNDIRSVLVSPASTRGGDSFSGLAWSPKPTGLMWIARGHHLNTVQADTLSNLGYHGNTSNNLLQDNEVQRLQLTTRRGLQSFNFVASLEGSSRNGGFMDPVIRFWHASVVPYRDTSLGVPQDGLHRVTLRRGDQITEVGPSGWRLNRLETGVYYRKQKSVMLGTVIKFPLSGSRGLMDRGSTDVAFVGSVGTRVFGWDAVWEGQSVTSSRSGDNQDIVLHKNWFNQTFSFVNVFARGWAAIVQYDDLDSGITLGLPYSEDKRRQMTFGVRRQHNNTILDLLVTENVRPFRTTPYVVDVGFTLALRRYH